MRGPLGFYIDLVDGAAFDLAEAGAILSKGDYPVAPLLFPWVIGGPMLAFLPLSHGWSTSIFAVTMFASVACWSGFAIFQYRRFQHYRRELGRRD